MSDLAKAFKTFLRSFKTSFFHIFSNVNKILFKNFDTIGMIADLVKDFKRPYKHYDFWSFFAIVLITIIMSPLTALCVILTYSVALILFVSAIIMNTLCYIIAMFLVVLSYFFRIFLLFWTMSLVSFSFKKEDYSRNRLLDFHIILGDNEYHYYPFFCHRTLRDCFEMTRECEEESDSFDKGCSYILQFITMVLLTVPFMVIQTWMFGYFLIFSIIFLIPKMFDES